MGSLTHQHFHCGMSIISTSSLCSFSALGTKHLLQASLIQEGEGGNLALAKFSIGGCNAAGEPQRVRDMEGDPSVLSSLRSPLFCPQHCSNALPEEPICYFHFFMFPCFLFLSGSGAQVPQENIFSKILLCSECCWLSRHPVVAELSCQRVRMLLGLALLLAGAGSGRVFKLNRVRREGNWKGKSKFPWSPVLSRAATLGVLESWDEGSEVGTQPAAYWEKVLESESFGQVKF